MHWCWSDQLDGYGAIAGYPAIWFLRRQNVSKEIYEYLRAPVAGASGRRADSGPRAPRRKGGQAAMGGIFLLAGILATTLGGNLVGRYSVGLAAGRDGLTGAAWRHRRFRFPARP